MLRNSGWQLFHSCDTQFEMFCRRQLISSPLPLHAHRLGAAQAIGRSAGCQQQYLSAFQRRPVLIVGERVKAPGQH